MMDEATVDPAAVDAAAADSDFLVVGGGIGGLATALALTRAGRTVRVLERAADFGEVGAGLQLAPNATRLLREWGLLDTITATAVVPRRLVLADAVRGGELASLDLGEPFVARYGAPYLVLHRSDLLNVLLGACRAAGVALCTAADVVDVHADASGVEARCADGRAWRGGALIGADGLRSRVRAELDPGEPICSGYVAYRGAIPMAAARHQADPRDVVAWIGPGRHLVQYRIRGGEMYNQVAVFRSERYRRGESDWGTPEELRAAFADSCDHVRGAIGSLWLDQRWPMFDREPIDTWVSGGRVALIGDAAHPMLQYLAQGACQALEDAHSLASAVAAAGDLPGALLEYQRQRAPRTARVQRNARVWGDIWHLDGLPARLRDEVLAGRWPTDYTTTDWLYGAGPALRDSTPGRVK